MWPLSAEGEAQAARLAEAPFWRRLSALYSSPEAKALATVRPAAGRHGLRIHERECLREVRREWTEDYPEAVHRFLERPDNPQPGWEPMPDARRRICDCIDSIQAQHGSEAVAVAGHGLAFTLYLSTLAGNATPAFQLWHSMGFGHVAVVVDGKLTVPFSDPLELP